MRQRAAWPAACGTVIALVVVPLVASTLAARGTAAVTFEAEEVEAILRLSPLPPPPPDPTNVVADDPRAARLGQFLFFDRRLSANGRVACATCHDPARGFADGRPLARGIAAVSRHAPGLLNTVYQRWYFWDGRADSLWAQAVQPLEHPKEHGTDRLHIAHTIHGDPALRQAYEDLFGQLPALAQASRFPRHARPAPTQPEHPHHRAWQAMRAEDRHAVNRVLSNVTKSIAAYERRLVRGQAPFDRFVAGLRKGDVRARGALSVSAQRGLKLFVGGARCIECHSGPNFSDLEFHNLGLPARSWLGPDTGRAQGIPRVRNDPFNATGAYSDASPGSFTQKLRFLPDPGAEQQGQFKTPTLRNVALTAPYMHGGHFRSLEQVLRFYSTLRDPLDDAPIPDEAFAGQREGTLQPLHLSEREIQDLAAFLRSLTGAPLDPALLVAPPAPVPSTAPRPRSTGGEEQ